MTETEQALARELARHPAWRWRDGMMSNAGRVWTNVANPHGAYDATPRLPDGHRVSTGHYPDLADPATQGCLIAMLPVPRVSVYGTGEAVVTAGYETRCEGSTLGEALARAWLAVKGDEPK